MDDLRSFFAVFSTFHRMEEERQKRSRQDAAIAEAEAAEAEADEAEAAAAAAATAARGKRAAAQRMRAAAVAATNDVQQGSVAGESQLHAMHSTRCQAIGDTSFKRTVD